jgi:Ca2+-transporting ATPase
MVILFGFAGISEWSGLGMVIGALSAGVVTRPSFDRAGEIGEQARQVIGSISYGFLAPVFFLWVGLHMDLRGLIEAPTLTLLLIASAFLAKLASVLLMVPLHRINLREGWIIAVSINAGLTTEIIVAQLMLDAQLIDIRLFTALVAASSVTTIGVPLVLTMLIHHWQDHISNQREA